MTGCPCWEANTLDAMVIRSPSSRQSLPPPPATHVRDAARVASLQQAQQLAGAWVEQRCTAAVAACRQQAGAVGVGGQAGDDACSKLQGVSQQQGLSAAKVYCVAAVDQRVRQAWHGRKGRTPGSCHHSPGRPSPLFLCDSTVWQSLQRCVMPRQQRHISNAASKQRLPVRGQPSMQPRPTSPIPHPAAPPGSSTCQGAPP